MQEIIGGGAHTKWLPLCGMETATGQAVMVGFAGAWSKHTEKRQHGGQVSPWPLVMVELLALNWRGEEPGVGMWEKDSWQVSEHPTPIVFLVSSYGNNKHSEIFIATVIYEKHP